MFKKILLGTISLCVLIVLFQYFNVGTPEDLVEKPNFEIIAHRGVHQHYQGEGKDVRYKNTDLHSCEASRIESIQHPYIENTVESIEEAFNLGATIVEIDIRHTKDNQLVVFHDDTLDCKTNGTGKIWQHTAEALQQLDVGYGYTADGGQTYPLRGTGIGGIKTLTEILNRFPDKRFLIDNKNGDNVRVAESLVYVLSSLPESQLAGIYLWSKDKPFLHVQKSLPSIRRLLLPRKDQKEFYISYIAKLGLGGIPEGYSEEGLFMTQKYTPYIWGWPYKFLKNIQDEGIQFYLYANSAAELNEAQRLKVNGVVTEYIESLEAEFL